MKPPPHTSARPHCYRCDKPLRMCLCRHLRPIPNTIGVHVLQHPRERRHPLGTARLLRLGLESVQVHALDMVRENAGSTPVTLPPGAGLLYPSAGARDLATLSAEERPRHLVVIDGTWAHANRIYRDNSWISALPHYRLSSEQPSRYRIRTEPRPECLSTVESVVAALRCLQPDLRGTEMLDVAFDAMIDAQIAESARPSLHARGKRRRVKPARAVPEPLSASHARVVVVHTEAGPLRPNGPGPRAPVRLSAVALHTGRVFDRMLQGSAVPDAHEAALMGLTVHDFHSAQPVDDVLDAFRQFCSETLDTSDSSGVGRDGPAAEANLVLVTWGVRTHRWLAGAFPGVPCVLLKGVWANIGRAQVPALETLVQSLGLATPRVPVSGRSGRHLTHACAMVRHILRVGTDG